MTASSASRSSASRARASFFVDGDWAYSVALVVLSLAMRLLVALVWAREPVWDGHYYHFGAERIAEGWGYSEDVLVAGRAVAKPWTHYPVGYSAFLAFFYRVFGAGLSTAPIVGAVTGTLLVLVVHRVGRHLLSPARARIAAALAALHPGLIAYSAVVMTEPLAALLLLLAAWAALALERPALQVIVVGVLLGLGALVRPASLLAIPAVGLCLGPVRWRGAVRTVLATVIALLVILPWTLRNCRVMDGCALVSTNGGWNLAIGAITKTGRFETLRASDGCDVVTGQVQQDRCWASRGRELILADPASWFAKIPAKLSQTYDHESFAVEYLREAAPDLWPEPRREAGRKLTTFFHRLLVVLASWSVVSWVASARPWSQSLTQWTLLALLLGMGARAFSSDEHFFYPLVVLAPLVAVLPLPGRPPLTRGLGFAYGILAATSVTHAIFFGEDRYHLVTTPILCLLAAAALRQPAWREPVLREPAAAPTGVA